MKMGTVQKIVPSIKLLFTVTRSNQWLQLSKQWEIWKLISLILKER